MPSCPTFEAHKYLANYLSFNVTNILAPTDRDMHAVIMDRTYPKLQGSHMLPLPLLAVEHPPIYV